MSVTSTQVVVNHQIVIVTESYHFRNDGQTSVDSVALCSTQEYAATRAHEEVSLIMCDVTSLLQQTMVLTVTPSVDCRSLLATRTMLPSYRCAQRCMCCLLILVESVQMMASHKSCRITTCLHAAATSKLSLSRTTLS